MTWRVIDERAVAGVGIVTTPGEEPPGAPGAGPPTGLPRAGEKKPATYLDQHKAVKKIIDKAGYKYLCTTPAEIAAATGLPLEIVEEHLSLLEIDEAAKFVQKGTQNPTICGTDALQRLVESLRKLKV